MDFLRLVFWLVAYTAGVVRLSVAIVLFTKRRTHLEFKQILFLISFGGIVVSLSNMELMRLLKLEAAGIAGYIGLFFTSALTFSLPMFVHADTEASFRHKRDIAAVLTSFASLIILMIKKEAAILPIVLIMSASVAYSMIILFLAYRKNSHSPGKYNIITAIAVTCLLVPMIIFDFIYPITNGYIFVPLLYLLVNVLMLISEIPLVFSSKQGGVHSTTLEHQLKCAGLTSREREVALLLMKGKTYQKIGEELFISLQTVKTHASRVYMKTGASNKMELLDMLNSACKDHPIN